MKNIMKNILAGGVFVVVIAFISCSSAKVTTQDDGKIEAVFVQINDVYEIAPINGGAEGGMARIATLKKQYLKTNPNTFLIMAGDFLSPSIYNSLQYNGKKIRGAQMVEAMNSAGMDFACFGNHEFDLNENDLQERLNESTFTWISSNAFHKVNNDTIPFTKNNRALPTSFVKAITDADGTTAEIGFIGLVLPANRADYVAYTDALSSAKKFYAQMKDSVDAIVAITHQDSTDDKILAKELPGLAAIIGGHEHVGFIKKVGNVSITKAVKDGQSAVVIKLNINKRSHDFIVQNKSVHITDSIALDSTTNVVVDKWNKIMGKSYATLGFNINEVIISSGEPLETRETVIYRGPSNFTRLVTNAMAAACPQADVVMFNAGSSRLDDIIIPPVTQYDLIRIMAYGGGLREVDMKGSMLVQVLDSARENINKGGWLHYQPVIYNAAANLYNINNIPIDPLKIYRVALTDFLLTGKEVRLDFLNEKNPSIIKVYPAETALNNPKSDIRLAIIKYLQKKRQ